MNKWNKNRFYILAAVALVILVGGFYTISKLYLEKQPTTGAFSTNTTGLTSAIDTPTVTLNNGDNYTLDAKIVKKQINGKVVKMLAYNGSVPGPIIKVTQGTTVHIKLVNNTDIATTLHPHGVRTLNKFDGIPDVTQKAVEVGQSFTYTLSFPDAGVFWYHPHVREDYSQESGLYGNFIVSSKNNSYSEPVTKEVPVFLDDVLMTQAGIAPFRREVVSNTLMGRFGNTMLVNGKTNYTDTVHTGDIVRYYLTNSSNTRVFRVVIPNAQMKLLAADSSKYEKEQFVDSVTLGPAERAIVDVLYGKPGTYHLQHISPASPYELGTITVDNKLNKDSNVDRFAELKTNQDVEESIAPFKSAFNKPPDKSLKLTLDLMQMKMSNDDQGMNDMHGGMMSGNDMNMQTGTSKIEWEDSMKSMNAGSTNKTLTWKLQDEATEKSNMDINWTFKRGDKVKIKIFNDPKSAHPMQHPIHIHGQRFLVLTKDGIPNTNMAWKDTVLVENGQTVEILVDMSNPGTWMTHCHIPEHMESGMMFNFKVI